MKKELPSCLLVRLFFQPNKIFTELADTAPSSLSVFFKAALWLGIIPPIFAFLGASKFGWRLGAVEPLYLNENVLIGISLAYFLALLIGFVSSAVVSKWMATTYGARHSLGIHFAMITIVGAPLALGSIIHIYPDVFLNVLVFVPVMLWSMYLLYRGLPVVLNTTPERGMLMASSLIGYLLVAFVSLLGITVFLWINGIGPSLGV
ncbi:MAG: Yip1 family protein [Gammaproteobacteria bacterium]